MADTSSYNTDAALLALCRAKGISPYFATQITRLREYSSIRLVLDDSGSMKSMLNIYGAAPTTRWQLLQTMVKEIFDLMAIARGGDREPVSVHLLNMLPQGMKCESVGQLQEFFQSGPTGTTPTLEVMRDIMTPEHMVYEEGVLTLLITDGAPNCGHQAFRNFLLDAQRRYPASYITVGLCTDVSCLILLELLSHLEHVSPYFFTSSSFSLRLSHDLNPPSDLLSWTLLTPRTQPP
jgi:hypothetical protein